MAEALGPVGLTTLWNKIKATFGVKLEIEGTTLSLKNAAATPVILSQVTIPVPEGGVTMNDVNAAITAAQVGAAMYKGMAESEADISGSDYKVGWYWVVKTAGTYCGELCESGDMIFANSDKNGAFSADHFDMVQNNIVEMTAAEVETICTL